MKRAEIVALYDGGQGEAARDEAERAGEKDLVSKLNQFLQTLKTASDAAAASDGTAAIQRYDAALDLDGQITNSSSTYATTIRKRLGELWVQAANTEAKQGNNAGARSALSMALKYDPASADAAKFMERMSADAPSRAPVTSGRAPIKTETVDAPRAGVEPRADRFHLLQERQDLLANMPNPVFPIVGLAITVPFGIVDAILIAVDPGSAILWGVLLAVDIVCAIIDVVFLGIGISRKSAAEERLAEIDRQLALRDRGFKSTPGLIAFSF